MFARLKHAADAPARPAQPATPAQPQAQPDAQAAPAAPARPSTQPAPAAPAQAAAAPLLGALQSQVKPSIISDAVSFVGELTSTGPIHIDGNAKGTVEAETVTIGTGGSFDGRVTCRKLHVKGTLAGSAFCEELIISEEARIKAALTYKTMIVAKGAQVHAEVFLNEAP